MRVRNAIFAKAFGESESGMNAISRMSESTDNNVKNITNGLLAKAGKIAALRQAAKEGTRYKDFDIASDLAKGMEKYASLKDSGTSVDEYIAQGHLFGAETTPFQTRVMQVFDTHKKSAKAIRGILDNYLALVEELGNPNQTSLFGEKETPSVESVFETAVKSYEQSTIATPTDQFGLFDQNQGREVQPEARQQNDDDAQKVSGQAEAERGESRQNRLDSPLYTKPETPNKALKKGEINLKNLYNKDGEFDYEQVKNVAGRIASGEIEISRLTREEETGRLEGGRRNVEASIIAGTSARADQTAPQRGGIGRQAKIEINKQVEADFEKYARHEGIFFDYADFTEKHHYYTEGEEAQIFRVDDGKSVLKAVDYNYFSPTDSPLRFIDERISLFNYLFPETKYELVGFARDENGKFRFILKQPFIVKGGKVTERELAEFMTTLLGQDSELTSEEFANLLYHVSDLHLGNVIKGKDGRLYVIDAFTEYTPARLGGAQEGYAEFSISDKSDDDSVLHSKPFDTPQAKSQEKQNQLLDDLNKVLEKDFTLESVKKAHIDKDGRMNEEAYFLIAHAHNQVFRNSGLGDWTGVFLNPNHVQKVRRGLVGILGNTTNPLSKLYAKRFLKQYDGAIKENGEMLQIATSKNVPNNIPEAWQEETAHKFDFFEGDGHRISDDIFPNDTIGMEAIDNLGRGAYKGGSVSLLAREVGAKIHRTDAAAELGITQEKVDHLRKIQVQAFRAAGKTKADLVRIAKEIKYAGETNVPENRPRRGGTKGTDGRNDGSGTGAVYRRVREVRERRTDLLRQTRTAEKSGQIENLNEFRNKNRDLRAYQKPENTALVKSDSQTLNPFEKGFIEKQFAKHPEFKEAAKNEILYARASKSDKMTFGDYAIDVANMFKSFKATADLSAAGRQGFILSITHPRIAFRAFVKQLLSLSEARHKKFVRDLDLHPFVEMAEDAGLFLSNLSKESSITEREEAFMSRILGDDKFFENAKAEAVRRGLTFTIRAAERAYTTYLDDLRINTFALFARQIHERNTRKGILPTDTEIYSEQMKGIAAFVNSATGRGDLGKLNDAAPLLNAGFFSARYWKSRLDLMNPLFYKRMPPGARNIALKNLAGFIGATALLLILWKLGGGDIEFDDPDDPDTLKIKFGGYSYDITAGMIGHLRYIVRMGMAFTEKDTGGKMAYLTERYVRSKLAPVPAAAVNTLSGKNFIGEPTSLKEEVLGRGGNWHSPLTGGGLASPIMVTNFYEAAKTDGSLGIIKVMPEFFGIGGTRFKTAEEIKSSLETERSKLKDAKTPKERQELARRIKTWANLLERTKKYAAMDKKKAAVKKKTE